MNLHPEPSSRVTYADARGGNCGRCHQRARKTPPAAAPNKYHAPCIHADNAKPMHVRASFGLDGVCVTGFDQENRMAISTPSVRSMGRAWVKRIITSGMATIYVVQLRDPRLGTTEPRQRRVKPAQHQADDRKTHQLVLVQPGPSLCRKRSSHSQPGLWAHLYIPAEARG